MRLKLVSKGIASATAAFILWGLLPLYWKLLQGVPAFQILLHRIVWSAIFLAIILRYHRKLVPTLKSLQSPSAISSYLISATLIGCNWLIYIWAVNAGHVMEASLGYFLNPLVSVLLGTLFLGERLSRLQLIAITLALIGVLVRIVSMGELPWISLSLALTFGFYGLLRKIAKQNSTEGLFAESIILSLPALFYLGIIQMKPDISTLISDWWVTLLLIGAGPVTAIPLVLFAYGARQIKLSTVGIIQYITPSIQLFLAVFVFKESFTTIYLISFIFIWAAVGLYIVSLTPSIRCRNGRELKV